MISNLCTKSFIFKFILVFLFCNSLFAQEIGGSLKNIENGEPIIGAKIINVETLQEVTTDSMGNFTLAGSGNFTINAEGFKKIIVKNLKNGALIEMESDAINMQTIEISGRTKRDYNSDYSFSATKIAIKIKICLKAFRLLQKN